MHNLLKHASILVFSLVCFTQLDANETKSTIFKELSFTPSAQELAREKLLLQMSGEWITRSIYVATKLQVADHLLSGPKSSIELGEMTGTNPDSLNRLLRLLAGVDIFQEVGDSVYANNATSLLLSKEDPNSLHHLTLFYGEVIHPAWDELLPSVTSGQPAFELTYKSPVFRHFKENPSTAQLFNQSMKEKSRAVAESAITAYQFGQFKSIYDIGGGVGQFMKALLTRYPEMEGVVFDLPEVIHAAPATDPILKDRCRFVTGDFFESVPEGGGAYLLKSVIHDWNDEKSITILKACSKAMSSDSRLLLIEAVISPNGPIYAKCMDMLMLAITGGKERTLDKFNEILMSAGFELVAVYPTTTEFCILEARKIGN